MSNPSLKEQLQAIAMEFPSRSKSSVAQPSRKNKLPQAKSSPERKVAREPAAKPAWLEQARYGVELLKAHYPGSFKEQAEVVPLKIGIRQDLIKHLGGRADIAIADKACMASSLSYYVNSPAYHRKVKEGATRFDLDGHPAGVVTAEEASYSEARCEARQQKKQAANHTKN